MFPRDAGTAGPERRGAARPAARVAALVALALAVALVAFLTVGSGGYEVTATFQNAGQLVVGDRVEVGGRPIGKVTGVELDDASRARVAMEIDGEFEPLHLGTTAAIRPGSLSGIANRAVWLAPGAENGRPIADGGDIGANRTESPVELDQLFDALDPSTRRALRQVIRGSATQYSGMGDEAGRSLEYLSPALASTSRLTQEITSDKIVFDRLVRDGATVVSSVATRRDDLADLVSNLGVTMKTIADEDTALDRSLSLLPPTLGRATPTLRSLRSTLDALDPLVAASKPGTRDLPLLLRRLRPLAADARPTLGDLRRLVRRPGQANDLVELTERMPRLSSLTSRVFPRTIRTLSESQPVIDYARLYTPDLVGWLTKFGQVAAGYDANGHFARIQPAFSPYKLNPATSLLGALPGGSRLEGFQTGNSRRCPGSAAGALPDGSAPLKADDCDPSATPGAP